MKILHGVTLFLLIFLISISNPALMTRGQTRWVFTDVAQGIMPSLALDSRGSPHVAFMRIGENGWVKYATLQNSQWKISQVSSGDLYGPPSIALDRQDSPHIVWLDHDSRDNVVYPGNERCLSVFVCKPSPGGNAVHDYLRDSKWTREDIVVPGHDGWDASIVIGKDDEMRIASVVPDLFNNPAPGIEYSKRDANGKWWVSNVDLLQGENYSHGTSITLDSENRPLITYFDDSKRDLRLATLQEGKWKVEVIDNQGDVGRFPSVAIDRNGNPTIAYLELLTSTTGWVKIATKTKTGWSTERVDRLNDLFLQAFSADSRGARNIIALAFDSNYVPHIAYSDEAVLKHAAKQSEGWNVETILTSGDGAFGQTTSFKIDSNDMLHVVFVHGPTKDPVQSQWTVRYGTTSLTPNGSFMALNTIFPWAIFLAVAFGGIVFLHKANQRRKTAKIIETYDFLPLEKTPFLVS